MLDLRHPIISSAPTPASMSMLSFLGNLASSMDSASTTMTTTTTSAMERAVSNAALFASAPALPSFYPVGLKSAANEHSSSACSSPVASPVSHSSAKRAERVGSVSPLSDGVQHSSVQQSGSSPVYASSSSPELSHPSPFAGLSPHSAAAVSSYAAGLSALPHAFHPALHMQSALHQSLRNLHGFHAAAAGLPLPPNFGLTLPSPSLHSPKMSAEQPESSSKSTTQSKSSKSEPASSPQTTSAHNKSTESNSEGSPVSATPHGIEHILNRPLPRMATCNTNQQPFALHGGFSPSSHPQPPPPSALNLAGLGGLPPPSLAGVYWPTLPGFIGNPALQAWRDRINSGNHPPDFIRTI